MHQKIIQAKKLLTQANNITILTGAGISVESGIPDFRSPGGLWEKYDPFEYAHIDSFMKNPYKVWEMLKEMNHLLYKAKPNFAHKALKILEDRGKKITIVTQNIDALHSMAGSSHVYEYHGVWNKLVCVKCGDSELTENYNIETIPHCPTCNFPYKPAVIFFGEPIDPHISAVSSASSKNCDLFMVIGTSAQVYPAAYLPDIAHKNNKPIIEINLEETPLTNRLNTLHLKGKATEIMKKIID